MYNVVGLVDQVYASFCQLMKTNVTVMAGSSISSSMQSYASYNEPFTEEQEMAIYKSIRMVRLCKIRTRWEVIRS